MIENVDRLARGWWEGQRLANGTREERKLWSLGEPPEVERGWQAARELIDRGGENALELVVALLRSMPDEAGAVTVGAGPLEDLIAEHGNEISLRIDELARRCPLFRQALSSVWLEDGALDSEAARRLTPWTPTLGTL
ncbi:hypothetical protein I6A60_01270 [Frankia sp. AgB1.9]|uniref:DUF6869 domain-containing protein n=1 Tax=unclassified Frankia TaxID=2632575 RepID=UPI0019349722|nr:MULTISPECIES: hypothetical protein [unclassified Frankia]MBL7490134.1 hypothetical protein [Frankia sp. AgW1.1]MBL7546517.1 hypothetical protein [Frankia sp. AgB1.9]MBL7620224.1 hypothetical protein [Frankia sp. AgB1.8]